MKNKLMQHLAAHFPGTRSEILRRQTNSVAEKGILNLSRQKIEGRNLERVLTPIFNHFEIGSVVFRGVHFGDTHSSKALQQIVNILNQNKVRSLKQLTFAGQSENHKINLSTPISQLFSSNPELSHLNLDYNGQSVTSMIRIVSQVQKTQLSHLSIKDSTDPLKFLAMTEELCPNVILFNGIDTIHMIEAKNLINGLNKLHLKDENSIIDFALNNPSLIDMKNGVKHLINTEYRGKEKSELLIKFTKAEGYLQTQNFLDRSNNQTLEGMVTLKDLAQFFLNKPFIDIEELAKRNPKISPEKLMNIIGHQTGESSLPECLDNGISFVQKLKNQERNDSCRKIG